MAWDRRPRRFQALRCGIGRRYNPRTLPFEALRPVLQWPKQNYRIIPVGSTQDTTCNHYSPPPIVGEGGVVMSSKIGFSSGTNVFCAGLLAIVLLSLPLTAQMDSMPAVVRGLNNDLLRLHGRLRQSSPGQAVAARREARAVIEHRALAFGELMRHEPAQALSLAFPPETLADLATAFPESAARLDSQGQGEGTR